MVLAADISAWMLVGNGCTSIVSVPGVANCCPCVSSAW